MSEVSFSKTIQLIHKEIQGKLNNTNSIINNYIASDIPIIPKLGQYFFKKRVSKTKMVNNIKECHCNRMVKLFTYKIFWIL